MRFFTFFKEYGTADSGIKDEDIKAFTAWINRKEIAKKNPQASPAYLTVYLHGNNAPENVVVGFYKVLDAYNAQLEKK